MFWLTTHRRISMRSMASMRRVINITTRSSGVRCPDGRWPWSSSGRQCTGDELMEDWRLCESLQQPKKILPLD
jgi:hypothetical protein